MSTDKQRDAALALHRFGFGPRDDAIVRLAADPRGGLMAELDRPGIARIDDPDLPDAGEAARAAFAFRQERKAARFAERATHEMERQAKAQAQTNGQVTVPPNTQTSGPANAPANLPANAAGGENGNKARDPGPGIPQQIFLAEAKARFDRAVAADTGFAERLVWFWSNHFCVSADKVRPLAGVFEREAIRPHVLGRFADMLVAVESHPAMLAYLDNARSIGPDSQAGRNRGKGLNENLAREILELHTLGVRTGYTQDDVTSFAKVITGWTIVPPRQNPEHGGEFTFNFRLHQPGAETVAGGSYPEPGLDQGRAVLLDLARNPATAQHIATKLARHFIADDPPPRLVAALKATFLRTDGDLKELARTLVDAPEAWNAPRTKLKRPGEWFVAATRATGASAPDARPMIGALNLLGEPLWRPPAPKGFDDLNAAWVDGLAQRIDIANQFARRVTQTIDPKALVEMALGPLASAETSQTVARAESRPQAVALLLMSAEFQRR
jgi:uncharacterized protein (DUF1800 family)